MRKLPKIQRLLKGESPLAVFECRSIQEAREAFRELRKKFDFSYWAATEYYIRDINDADRIIPLKLNNFQHYLIDILQKRYHNREIGRYIITKSFGRVGLTTCIQAYMLWLQTYQCYNNSFTCSSSAINLNPLKTDLCRHLKRNVVPSEPWIYLPKADRRAFFNTLRSPDFIRGINLGYVHFADMSKWHDPDGDDASRVYASATSAVLMQYYTLIVLEGNIPQGRPLPYGKAPELQYPVGYPPNATRPPLQEPLLPRPRRNGKCPNDLRFSSLPHKPRPYLPLLQENPHISGPPA